VQVNASGDVGLGDGVVIADTSSGNITMTLPFAADAYGKIIVFYKYSAGHTLTVAAKASETINGVATQSFTSIHSTFRLFSTGTEWLIIA
jgi:hypothetical protein